MRYPEINVGIETEEQILKNRFLIYLTLHMNDSALAWLPEPNTRNKYVNGNCRKDDS